MAFDVVIRGGRVADGSGMPSFQADVAIQGGRIVRIGRVTDAAKRVIDADGAIVTPGFIDVHTHYDVVNGEVLLEDGVHTGALPGHVIRGA